MKVLILSHSSSVENVGGAELTLLQMIDHWRTLHPRAEFLVVARTPEGHLQEPLNRRQVQNWAIDFDSWVLPNVRVDPDHVLLTARMDSDAVLWLVELMRREKPDVVITNTIISPWAALAAKYLGIVHVWMVHEYGDLDHGLDFRIGRDQTFEDIGLLSDLVVANSVAVRDHIAPWIPSGKLTISYPVIDLERARSFADHAPAQIVAGDALDDALRVVIVGRLAESKGQWRLVRAISKLRDEGIMVRATLVGGTESEDARELLSLIDKLGLADQVTATGESPNPFVYIRDADVGITASSNEAFGRVTVEYMALGRPVIASNAGASPELVTDGETGWLFDPDEIDDLVRCLREAHGDRDEMRRRGKAARRSVDDQLAGAYPLDAAIQLIEQTVMRGSGPIDRFPHFIEEWLRLPEVADDYARGQAALQAEVYGSLTWRIGVMLSRPARWARGLVPRKLSR